MTFPIKVDGKDVLTFDIANQDVILNFLNTTKVSALTSVTAASLCNESNCYNCVEVKCSNINCLEVQCLEVKCNQTKCSQCEECTNCSYDAYDSDCSNDGD